MSLWSENMLKTIVIEYNYMFFYYFLLLNSSYFIMTLVAFREIVIYVRQIIFWDRGLISTSEYTPPISILTPAHNEELNIVQTVLSLMALDYPSYEVVVINDGSTDQTLEILKKEFDLRPIKFVFRPTLKSKPIRGIYASATHSKLIVLDKENGGKSDALNAGINIIRYPLFCSIDGDTIIEKDALIRVAKPMMEDPTVVATAGIVRVLNGSTVHNGAIDNIRVPRQWIPLVQIVEYLRAFLANRTTWSLMNTMLIISGAFGLFRKDLVVTVGGYSTKTVSEDMELVMRMHEYLRRNKIKYSIKFISDPVCWTEVPTTLVGLARQRDRWHRGLVECLTSYKKMFLNPRYGLLGLFTVPYYWLFEFLGPFVEFVGYIFIVVALVFNFLNYQFLLLFFLVAVLFGTIISVMSVLLEEMTYRRYTHGTDLLLLFIAAVLENIVYRQLSTLWRVKAVFFYFFNKRKWGKSERKGIKLADTKGRVAG